MFSLFEFYARSLDARPREVLPETPMILDQNLEEHKNVKRKKFRPESNDSFRVEHENDELQAPPIHYFTSI